MKSTPMLFSGPMVKALLDGSKTQTRRIVKPQPFHGRIIDGVLEDEGKLYTPKFQAGGQIWVKETFYQFGHWEPVVGVKTKTGRQKWRFVAVKADVMFDAPDSFRKGRHHKDPSTKAWHKRLGRFMPRKLSRITLEIVNVRVERLVEISESDCVSEGIKASDCWEKIDSGRKELRNPHWAYAKLWESINGPGSWAKNPWVWVISFKTLPLKADLFTKEKV